MATASTSRHLAYNSPEPDTSSEDILPLAFDSEEELLSVFARLRGDLQGKTREKWEARGGADSGVELGKVEEVVLKVCWVRGLLFGRGEARCWSGSASWRS